MMSHYNDIPASELYNVTCRTMDGQRLIYWGVTINEAYDLAPIGGALTFEPILWKTALSNGSFALDLVREAWSGTLAIGTLAQIEAFESRIQDLTVEDLINGKHAA